MTTNQILEMIVEQSVQELAKDENLEALNKRPPALRKLLFLQSKFLSIYSS